jgi:hypothetical protein
LQCSGKQLVLTVCVRVVVWMKLIHCCTSRYRARPVSPPLSSLPKGSDVDPLTVSIALTKGPQCLEKLPNSILEKETSNMSPLAKETLNKKASLELCPCSEQDGTKADRLLQAILRPSKESMVDQSGESTAVPQQLPQSTSHKPTGLERLKHLFNKTISVPIKENNSVPAEVMEKELK